MAKKSRVFIKKAIAEKSGKEKNGAAQICGQ